MLWRSGPIKAAQTTMILVLCKFWAFFPFLFDFLFLNLNFFFKEIKLKTAIHSIVWHNIGTHTGHL